MTEVTITVFVVTLLPLKVPDLVFAMHVNGQVLLVEVKLHFVGVILVFGKGSLYLNTLYAGLIQKSCHSRKNVA